MRVLRPPVYKKILPLGFHDIYMKKEPQVGQIACYLQLVLNDVACMYIPPAIVSALMALQNKIHGLELEKQMMTTSTPDEPSVCGKMTHYPESTSESSVALATEHGLPVNKN